MNLGDDEYERLAWRLIAVWVAVAVLSVVSFVAIWQAATIKPNQERRRSSAVHRLVSPVASALH